MIDRLKEKRKEERRKKEIPIDFKDRRKNKGKRCRDKIKNNKCTDQCNDTCVFK